MTPSQTISELKRLGYKVFISHRRPMGAVMLTRHELEKIGRKPTEWPMKEGATTVSITDANGDVIARGEATCGSKDTFSYKMGLQVALGRAVCELSGEAERRRKRDEK